MNFPHVRRREGLLLAGAAALVPVSHAWAQAQRVPPPRLEWLTLIRRHHDSIERAFGVLLGPDNDTWEKRGLQLRSLDQLLTAHSLAEETAIYPAMALAGLKQEAEHLYGDEAHFKIEKLRLEMALRAREGDKGWRDTATALRDAVLRHARQDEEKDLFPRLRGKLDAAGNDRLAQAYNRDFARVLPERVRR